MCQRSFVYLVITYLSFGFIDVFFFSKLSLTKFIEPNLIIRVTKFFSNKLIYQEKGQS